MRLGGERLRRPAFFCAAMGGESPVIRSAVNRERLHGGGGRGRGFGGGGGQWRRRGGGGVRTDSVLLPTGDSVGGGRARQGLRKVIDDDGGPPGDLVDVPPRRRDDEGPAGVLRWGVVVEGEIAQSVVDEGRPEIARTEQDVRMRAHDDVRPGLDEKLGQ